MRNLFLLCTQLRNAYGARKSKILVPSSKHSLILLKILQSYGVIQGVSCVENKHFKVHLKYTKDAKSLVCITGLSKPSVPVYFSSQSLWKFQKSYGILILFTSSGLICHQHALKRKLGGMALCYIL